MNILRVIHMKIRRVIHMDILRVIHMNIRRVIHMKIRSHSHEYSQSNSHEYSQSHSYEYFGDLFTLLLYQFIHPFQLYVQILIIMGFQLSMGRSLFLYCPICLHVFFLQMCLHLKALIHLPYQLHTQTVYLIKRLIIFFIEELWMIKEQI